jgi:hypothetical protein
MNLYSHQSIVCRQRFALCAPVPALDAWRTAPAFARGERTHGDVIH